MLYENIVLIDDDTDDREIFLSALELVSDKVSCITLDNAKDALNKLVQQQLAADLIFLDLNMPLMSGQQFLFEIQKHDTLRKIPVIVLSTTSQVSAIETTKQLGAKDFFTKPDNFDDLVSMLKSVIN